MNLIIFLIVFAIVALISGLLWMIGLGVLSHIFQQPNLAIGYWHSVMVAFVVNLLLGGFTRSNK